jgi:hypothetical protein
MQSSADNHSAALKCTAVGVMNTRVPVSRVVAEPVSWPLSAELVITTKVSPVSAPADEPTSV